MKPFFWSGLFLFFCVCTLSAQQMEFSVHPFIDWQRGRLVVDAERALDLQQEYTPVSRYQAEHAFEEQFQSLLYTSLLDLQVDSRHTLQDYLLGEPAFHEKFNALIDTFSKEYSFLAADQKEVHFRYGCSLFGKTGLIHIFLSHTRALPLAPRLGFVPTRNYSGLVIYARGDYPLYGKQAEGKLQPVLFPNFYNQRMELIYARTYCDPEFLERWGEAAYTSELDESAFSGRIGLNPLRTSVLGLFGEQNTDLILTDEVADKIYALESNRRLLAEGRVLIICELP